MESNAVLSDFYRLRLGDALRGRLELSASQIRADAVKPAVVADVLTLHTVKNPSFTPYDPGEAKHPPLDRKSIGDTGEEALPVKQVEQPPAASPLEYAHHYLVMSTLDRSGARRKREDLVRRSKRAGTACPFRDDNGQCTALAIRCGDRLQFSMRESGSEQRFLHKCTYDWRVRGGRVLIVDDEEKMRAFCASSFALFMRIDESRIASASSVDQAIDLLGRSKIDGNKFGLVIADIRMPGRDGYDLVNELYDRNFDVEIVLMKEAHEEVRIPAGYRGSVEVLPDRPFVSGILIKPFHSDALVMEVRKLRFGADT
ncbi:MAG: response regulator [Chitinispirillaceae bacterium]|nr:response regulator [Chitinispirillaceae bacterium]